MLQTFFFLQWVVNNMPFQTSLLLFYPLPLSVFTFLSLPKNFPLSLSLIRSLVPCWSPLYCHPPAPLSWQWNHFVSWYLYLLQDFKNNKEIERGLCEPWQHKGLQLAKYLMVARRSFMPRQSSEDVFTASLYRVISSETWLSRQRDKFPCSCMGAYDFGDSIVSLEALSRNSASEVTSSFNTVVFETGPPGA